MRITSIVAVATILATLLMSCSGDSDSEPPDPTTDEGRQSIIDSIEDSQRRLRENDARGLYEDLTERCRERMSVAEMAVAVEFAQGILGDSLSNSEVADLTITPIVGAPAARVAFALVDRDDHSIILIPKGDGERWVWEDGGWRSDDCE